MNNSLHRVTDNAIKTVLLECINKWYQSTVVYHYALSYNDCSIRVSLIVYYIQFFTNA